MISDFTDYGLDREDCIDHTVFSLPFKMEILSQKMY